MCVPILKSNGSELTSCDAKTLRHASWGLRTLLIGILTRNILKPTTSGSEVMAQIVVFVFSVTLTLTFDICSFFCHTHCA